MRIRWTPPAAADLQSISNYLKVRQPEYRQPTMRKLYAKIRASKDAPNVGRPGAVEGTRELLFSPMPYVAVYLAYGQTLEIWRIYHAAQNRP